LIFPDAVQQSREHETQLLSNDQGQELEPLDLVRRKGMTKAQSNPQSGYGLDEVTLKPKTLTAPDRRP
jgi:hypothetical protein